MGRKLERREDERDTIALGSNRIGERRKVINKDIEKCVRS
jgi:hypothetical protein